MGSRVHAKPGAPYDSLVARVLGAQLGVSMALAAIFWGMGGVTSGYSALLGGLTCVIPNAFLALRLAASRRDGRNPGAAGALLRAAYAGEIGKLALTVLMFGAVFALVEPLAAGPLFAGFIAAQLTTLAGLVMREDRGDPGDPGDGRRGRPDRADAGRNDRTVTTRNRNGD